MTNQAEHINKHNFLPGERFFLDTNVWIYIKYGFYTETNDKTFRNWYTMAYRKMLDNDCKIFVDAFVLSEFVTKFSHLEFDRKVPKTRREDNKNNYKIFKGTNDGKVTAQEIVTHAKKIIEIAELCNMDYTFLKIEDRLNDFKNLNLDFNDLIYLEFCKSNDLVLVTHDGDFKNCGIPILTGNNKLL